LKDLALYKLFKTLNWMLLVFQSSQMFIPSPIQLEILEQGGGYNKKLS